MVQTTWSALWLNHRRSLPVFKPGKWSLLPDSRVSLYGHDAKNMRNFTLHFDMAEQCDSLDRLWFGEIWFPVEKYVYQISILSYSMTRFQIQQILILKMATMSPNCVSPSLKSQIQLMPCSIVELLMFYFQDTCFPKELDHSRSPSILQ